MKIPKWLLGTTDGKHYIASTSEADLPCGAKPIPIHTRPTPSQIKTLEDQGCKVQVICPQEQSDA